MTSLSERPGVQGSYSLLVAAILLFLAHVLSANAREIFPSEEEMIDRSEIIAVVDVERLENKLTKATPFDYTQVSQASVEQTLKGSLPKTVTLHGGETFRNVAVQFPKGRYLVFLRRNGSLLVGAQAGMSARPIEDSRVLWHVPDMPRKLSWQPLDTVLSRIKARLPGGA